MNASLRIELNDHLFARNPGDTEIGRRLLTEAVQLIDEIGFEHFTFKKLAQKMGSSEATLYRYFDNKHHLLNYLVSWYWAWMLFQIAYVTPHANGPRDKMHMILQVLAGVNRITPAVAELDDMALARIVIREGSKSYLTHEVDQDNKAGFFQEYKKLARHIASVVREMSPDYAYPVALVSTVMEAARKQLFFAEHLPSLTEASEFSNSPLKICEFLEDVVFSTVDGSSQRTAVDKAAKGRV